MERCGRNEIFLKKWTFSLMFSCFGRLSISKTHLGIAVSYWLKLVDISGLEFYFGFVRCNWQLLCSDLSKLCFIAYKLILCFGLVYLINFSYLHNFCRLPLHLGSGDISLVRLHVFEVIIQRWVTKDWYIALLQKEVLF